MRMITSPDIHLIRVIKKKMKSLKKMRTGKEGKFIVRSVHDRNEGHTRHRRFRIEGKSLAIFSLESEEIAKLRRRKREKKIIASRFSETQSRRKVSDNFENASVRSLSKIDGQSRSRGHFGDSIASFSTRVANG